MIRLLVLLAALSVLPHRLQAKDYSGVQQKLYRALKRAGAISPETRLVSLTYVCALRFAGKSWPVANTIEHVRGAQVPRAQSQIVFFDRELKVVQTISYADQHPLFCRGNELFVNGDIGVNNTAPYGNVLSFFGMDGIQVRHMDPNELPVEITKDRKTYSTKR